MKFTTVLTALLLIWGVAGATVINVPGDQATIQAGINTAVDGDTVLVADGTYTGTGFKNLNFSGKGIVVMSANGPENCIIDCQYSGRGVAFQSGEDSTSVFKGFTIRNGAQGPIFILNANNPVVENCIIHRSEGVGIYCMNSDPTLIRCVMDSCISYSGSGGGMSFSMGSDPDIINCVFYNCSAGKGGCIHFANSTGLIKIGRAHV